MCTSGWTLVDLISILRFMIWFNSSIGVLHDLGGMDAVLTWGALEAKHWKQHSFDRCNDKAVREQQFPTLIPQDLLVLHLAMRLAGLYLGGYYLLIT